jgi:hypothetical protein
VGHRSGNIAHYYPKSALRDWTMTKVLTPKFNNRHGHISDTETGNTPLKHTSRCERWGPERADLDLRERVMEQDDGQGQEQVGCQRSIRVLKSGGWCTAYDRADCLHEDQAYIPHPESGIEENGGKGHLRAQIDCSPRWLGVKYYQIRSSTNALDMCATQLATPILGVGAT